MIEPRSVLGAVLAGGESRRMGRDKALLEVDGQALILRPLGALRAIFEEVVVVAPRDRNYARLGVEIVPDLRRGLGPLGGLHSALVRGGDRPVFVLACDMPFASAELVRYLLRAGGSTVSPREEWDFRRQVVARVPIANGDRQPLCALYSAGCRAVVERALDHGSRSALRLLDELEVQWVEIDEACPWYHPDLFMNVNDEREGVELARRLGAFR